MRAITVGGVVLCGLGVACCLLANNRAGAAWALCSLVLFGAMGFNRDR